MVTVRLPDGSSQQIADGASSADLAAKIGSRLAKEAVVAEVNGKVVDLTQPLAEGDTVRILTKKDSESLAVLRHSCAHLMADAILRIFPQAQLTIGPVIEDGFYYDIYLPEGKITQDDFPKIEEEMANIVKGNHTFQRCAATFDEANEHYARYRAIDGGHNKFKTEIIQDIKDRGENLTFYKHGDFIDLCRGPHVPHTGWLKNVKLTKVSGSYWRADAAREQLVRIYGIAFFSKEELEEYLKFLEEAKRRDHRVLGEQLELFMMEDVAPGFPFFLPKGAILWNTLADYMKGIVRRSGYVEVKTPLIMSEQLWHTSGHYDNYLENMFFTKLKLRDPKDSSKVIDNVAEERPMAVKPMNCPGHALIFKHRLRSHRELPYRIAELGLVHRRELSGVRHGLFRVQAFTQDDAHLFCMPSQIEEEIMRLMDFFKEMYSAFGLDDFRVELSTRPAKSIGSDAVWNEAERALKTSLEARNMAYQLNPGDGAFYGPKIDFHIRDSLKRSWQCGTIQLDFSMPERFGCNYVGTDGGKHTPVMIHRACFGSVERFLGILIEHYAGAFPLWLSPIQAVVIPVSDKFLGYAESIYLKLSGVGLRTEINRKDDRLGYKIREASLQKIPYSIVVGEKEVESSTVNIRSRDQGELGAMSLDAFIASLTDWQK